MSDTPKGKRKLRSVELRSDGKLVPMKGFVQFFIGSAILGMVSALKGVGEPKELTIRIESD